MTDTQHFDMLRIDGRDHTAAYAEHGYLHLPGAITPEFLAFAQEQARTHMANETDMGEWKFKGKKLQYLFDLSAQPEWLGQFLDVVADISGIDRANLTVCERHIKAYVGEAPENPPPHKDRGASEVTVGIPLDIPAGSHVVLYPEHHLEENPFATTALWRESLDEADLPEHALAGIEPLRVDAQPGDLLLFRGSKIYHERCKPANAVVLYIKLNGLRIDALGEDHRTEPQRQRSLELLESADDDAILAHRVEVSPRLDKVTRLYSRLGWREVVQAQVWGGKQFGLTEAELDALRSIKEGTRVRDLVSSACPLDRVRRLIRLQAIDLLG